MEIYTYHFSSSGDKNVSAHHASFRYSVDLEHLQDFADMAGIEFLIIDENTRVQEFREKLRWNDLYYHLNKAL